MDIELDRSNSQPLYLQVAEALKARIETGALPAQARLPATRRLAAELHINRITVVNAYAELEAEGLVTSHVGRGTFVAEPPPAPRDPQAQSRWMTPPSLPRPSLTGQMLRDMMRVGRQPGVISFAGGSPADEFLPVSEFRKALNDVLRRDGAQALQYEEAAGYYPLREIIARYLRRQSIPCQPGDVLITAGCQQALGTVLRVLAREGDAVLVEDPCYLGLLDIIQSHHLTPIGVPIDGQGMQVDRLEQLILRHRPRLIYVVPSFQNPTGMTMTLERRQALLEIATHYGVPILEDTTYREIHYDVPLLPPLKSLDRGDIVLHAGGFSKVLVPGIRIGYLVAPRPLRERLIVAKQTADILTSPLNQRALHAYLAAEHLPGHLATVRRAYRERRDVMVSAAEGHFPAEARWRKPDGGLYLWVEMPPEGPTATDLYLAAINYNVAFAIGSVFSAGGSAQYAMRLNFASCAPDEIEEGLRRLGKAWRELLSRAPAASRPQGVHIL
ncbi:MAG: PLP-dependent aminotransferase family protein [Anaerolineae bacterium]